MEYQEYQTTTTAAHYVNEPYDDFEREAREAGQGSSLFIREILETLLLTLMIFWIVNTMTGRFRIEGSSMEPTLQEGQYVLINRLSYFLEEPERGDVIVLHYPRDRTRDFIKRVIGLPGDTVRIEDGQVWVNEVRLDEPYINMAPSYENTWIVPQDNYFVLGDNRNNSTDSHRGWFLPREDIVGKGMGIYWPVDEVDWIPHFEHPETYDPTAG